MGRWTRSVLIVGLLTFLVLALLPNTRLAAVYAVLLTPVLATLTTAGELVERKAFWQALSLCLAVALIGTAAVLHSR